jgi:hypothetical protein
MHLYKDMNMHRLIELFSSLFLGEESWRFEVGGDKRSFTQRLRSISQPMPKYRYLLPYAGSIRRGFRAYTNEKEIILMKNPDVLSVRTLFSTSGLYYFRGQLVSHSGGNTVLEGRYKLTPMLRYVFLLFFVSAILLVLSSIISAAYLTFVALNSAEHGPEVVLVAIGFVAGSVLFCAFVCFLGRANTHVIRPYKDEVRNFLATLDG